MTRGFLTWDPSAEAITFHIEVSDLSDTPPLASVGEFFRFFFNYAGAGYQVTAARDPLGQSRDLRTGDNTGLAEGLAGAFDPATDEITIVLTADQFAAAVPAAPRFAEGAAIDTFEILGQRSAVAVVLTAESATGSCSYRIGQERLAPNRPPVAAADSAATAEDSAVTIAVLTNDSDPDGDGLGVQSVGSTDAGGSVAKNADGTVRYAPRADFFGTDHFSYTVSDGHGGSASEIVTVTVTPTQDPPAAAADNASTAAGQPVAIGVLANDSDPDGDPLTITGVTQGAGGRVAHDGTRVTYTPGGGFVQSDSFTYTVSDGHGGMATAGVTVFRDGCSSSFFDDLEPAQEPGWAFENRNALPVTPTWRLVPDPLAKSLTQSFFSDASDASANKDDRMTAPAQQIGPHTMLSFWHRFRTEANFDGGVIEVSTNGGVTYVDVTAAGGLFVTGGYNSTSNALNSRPAWTGASAPTMTEVVIDLGALAGTSARLRWRLVTDANLGDAGWWVDDVRFTDTISSACPSPNHAPVAADDDGRTDRGTAVSLMVLANDSDPDGDPLTVSAVTDPPGGAVA
ncbi:MAG: Ig-like domain-containing protein, partial [Gammaproteobacteria bacterium]